MLITLIEDLMHNFNRRFNVKHDNFNRRFNVKHDNFNRRVDVSLHITFKHV